MAYSADKKPGELTALASLATDDVFVVGDTSDTSEVAKYITKANLITDLGTSFEAKKGADDNYVTDAEKVVIGNTSGTNTGDNATNTQYSGLDAAKANVAGSLTQFVGNTAHRVFYSDASGDITELAFGADGTFLKSNGAAVAPSFAAPAGGGDVSKVGTPVDNQVGVWTGDGTIEGDTALTFDTSTNTLTTDTHVANTAFMPDANDGATLGTAGTAFADLFLAEGGVINWDNGDAIITQAGDVVTLSGADLKVTTSGNASTSVLTTDATQTFSNKRRTRRVSTTNAPGATPTTNTDNVDVMNFTGLNTAITSMTTNLSGTPVDGDLLEFRFTDDGTARAITWGASFAATTVALPTTTVISTMLRVGFEYSGSTWKCIATC